MIQINLNGEAHTVPPEQTLAELLAAAGLAGRRVAVEINREIVPRSRYAAQALIDGDRVEIVHAIGGG